MKRTVLILVALGLFAATPVLADHKKADHTDHTATAEQMDQDCQKECDLLIRDCAREVDSIQQRIKKIKAAIAANGAKPENQEELRLLNSKLKEVNSSLRALTKPGH